MADWLDRVPEEGESPSGAESVRAAKWVAHYDHLVDFERQIERKMIESAAKLPEAERRLIEETNLAPMGKLIAELLRRRTVWATQAARAAQLD